MVKASASRAVDTGSNHIFSHRNHITDFKKLRKEKRKKKKKKKKKGEKKENQTPNKPQEVGWLVGWLLHVPVTG